VTCLAAGIFVTSMFIHNVATVVTVCEFHCPDDKGGTYAVAAVAPYGMQCKREIQVDKDTRKLLSGYAFEAPPRSVENK